MWKYVHAKIVDWSLKNNKTPTDQGQPNLPFQDHPTENSWWGVHTVASTTKIARSSENRGRGCNDRGAKAAWTRMTPQNCTTANSKGTTKIAAMMVITLVGVPASPCTKEKRGERSWRMTVWQSALGVWLHAWADSLESAHACVRAYVRTPACVFYSGACTTVL